MSRLRAWGIRWLDLLLRRRERELDDELRAHLALHIDENLRAGMAPPEARRRAYARLGGVEQIKERCRDTHPLRWLGTLWLDVKLGWRMVRRSWGLTLVGGLAMTIGIAAGAVVVAMYDAFGATLPLDEGERVVALQTWDEEGHRRHETAAEDLERWRTRLRSVEDLGAYQTTERALTVTGRVTEPVRVAEMTASGFRLARVAPLHGRSLVAADERDDATPVVVVGHDFWQDRFGGDPHVVGTTVRFADTAHTVVGVMPPGFVFPVNHQLWTPLRLAADDALRDAGPGGVVFARLGAGTTLAGADTELTTLGLLQRADVGERLVPRAVPYTFAFTGDFERGEVGWVVRIILAMVTLLLIPPCANIAVLVYARTVTRQEEFAARYALGASRARIVGQLLVEMLVLATGAALAALGIARLMLQVMEAELRRSLGADPPFWMDFSLSLRTWLIAAGLALFAALVAGGVPALQATGTRIQHGLQALGSRASPRLGVVWTLMVVGQVALSLALLPASVELGWGTLRAAALGPGFAASDYLTARVLLDDETTRNEVADVQGELARRLEALPEVGGVAWTGAVPNEAAWTGVEVEPAPGLGDRSDRQLRQPVRLVDVGEGYFDVYDLPLLAGRPFGPSDFDGDRRVAIVSRAFARRVMDDESPVGHRLRVLAPGGPADRGDDGPWLEIVGVAGELFADARRGSVFVPAPAGTLQPASISLSLAARPPDVGTRLQQVVAGVDPRLRLDRVRFLDDIHRQQQEGNYLGALGLASVTVSVLLLSGAGIYALVAFTVSQRRREIGIRTALGASPLRLLAGVLRRAGLQVGVGLAVGALLATAIRLSLPIVEIGGWPVPGVLPGAAAFMLLLGLLAAAAPARRGLRVEPTEALRDG